MLKQEDNELITRVGPGTPMGTLMREYWVPALLSSELPGPDCNPVRVLLLGEKLIAFRDSQGQVGLLDNNCPHRGASLFFARNEECGLRCVYHGWKFGVDGQCLDMPNEPAEAMYGAYRPADAGREYWRVAQFLFPFYVMIPTGVMGLQRWVRAWVPMDDEHMLFISMYAGDALAGNVAPTTPGQRAIPLQPNTTDWLGRFRLIQNASNDYLIDREKQRHSEDYTGISGIHQQDQAITDRMEPI